MAASHSEKSDRTRCACTDSFSSSGRVRVGHSEIEANQGGTKLTVRLLLELLQVLGGQLGLVLSHRTKDVRCERED